MKYIVEWLGNNKKVICAVLCFLLGGYSGVFSWEAASTGILGLIVPVNYKKEDSRKEPGI